MAWAKATEAMIALFDDVLPRRPDVERRKMFGYPVGFVNGNMFCGLHENKLILRLGDEDRAAFIDTYSASIFEPMAGRPMREYVVATKALLEDRETMRQWVERSLRYAASLTAKKAAAPKKRQAKRTVRQ